MTASKNNRRGKVQKDPTDPKSSIRPVCAADQLHKANSSTARNRCLIHFVRTPGSRRSLESNPAKTLNNPYAQATHPKAPRMHPETFNFGSCSQLQPHHLRHALACGGDFLGFLGLSGGKELGAQGRGFASLSPKPPHLEAKPKTPESDSFVRLRWAASLLRTAQYQSLSHKL